MDAETTPVSKDVPDKQTDVTKVPEVKHNNGFAGRLSIGLKNQPEVLCNCPLHCDSKIRKEWRKIVYRQFQEISDHATQNQYIQRHIKIKNTTKRLWENTRRVTCKYLVPLSASVMESYAFVKTVTFDTVNGFDQPAADMYHKTKPMKETPLISNCKETVWGVTEKTPSYDITSDSTLPIPMEVDGHESASDSRKSDSSDINSPLSFHDNESINTLLDDLNGSDGEIIPTTVVNYTEVCQKAFMNMYGVTEKRIRWQREKLILKSRIQAEKKKKELEEIDRTLALAKSLGAGCQPLFTLLEKSNCLHLSDQLIGAIEADVALVNNFFHNQLWKPEDIMKKTIHVSHIALDSLDTDCD